MGDESATEYNQLLSSMVYRKREKWSKALSSRKGSAPLEHRGKILIRACNAIKTSAVRIGRKEDLLALKGVGNTFAGHALSVLSSESFQCNTKQTAEIGVLGLTILKVMCESQTDLNIAELLAEAQTTLSGRNGAEPVKSFSKNHKLWRIFLKSFFVSCRFGNGTSVCGI